MATAIRTITTSTPGTVPTIDSARHPVARRVADVLRSRSAKPRVLVIDDPENIDQAAGCGIELDSLYAAESSVDHGGAALASRYPDVPFHILDDAVARALFGVQKHSRIFALAHAPRVPRLRDLAGVPGDVLVLDGVRILGNIGAITRTAGALGAGGVVLLDSGLRTVFDRRLIRASRGLVFATPVVMASRDRCADFLRQEGLAVAGLSADATEPLASLRDLGGRVALLLGSERDGVSPGLDALAAHRFAIPMSAGVDSLNVSVAAGIALYEHGPAAAA